MLKHTTLVFAIVLVIAPAAYGQRTPTQDELDRAETTRRITRRCTRAAEGMFRIKTGAARLNEFVVLKKAPGDAPQYYLVKPRCCAGLKRSSQLLEETVNNES